MTPGCYGIYPAIANPLRFATLCGDGTASTYTISADRRSATPKSGTKFFEPEKDALYTHAERDRDAYVFLSYGGKLVRVAVDGETVQPLDSAQIATGEPGWAPGGLQPFAFDASRGVAYVLMHPNAVEGSHKNPSAEIWAYDHPCETPSGAFARAQSRLDHARPVRAAGLVRDRRRRRQDRALCARSRDRQGDEVRRHQARRDGGADRGAEMTIDPLIQFVAIGLTAIVFGRAVLEKATNSAIHVATLRDYRLLPEALAPRAAAVLLALEGMTLAALMLPSLRTIAALAAIGLLALYAVAMALALRAGRTEIECGCGGSGQIVSWGLVARNVVLMAGRRPDRPSARTRAMGWVDYAQGACAILIAWLLLAIAEKAIESQAAIRRLQTQSFL